MTMFLSVYLSLYLSLCVSLTSPDDSWHHPLPSNIWYVGSGVILGCYKGPTFEILKWWQTDRQTNRFSTCRLDPLRRNFEIDLSWKHLSFEFLLMPSASAALFEFHWGRQSSCLTEYSISEDLVLLGLSRINWKTDELHCITLYWFALEEVWWQRKVDGQGAAQSLLKANAIIIAATNILEY